METPNVLRRLFGRRQAKNEAKNEANAPIEEEKALDAILMTQDRTRITREVLEMGRKTCAMLEQSLYVVQSDNDRDAQAVIEQDNEVDRMEMEIDWECLSTMAMRQPIHDDLRFLFAVIKLTTDLERIADESTNVARHLLLHRSLLRGAEDLAELQRIHDCLLRQMEDVMRAFEKQDLPLAQQVFTKDRSIDACYNKLYQSFLDSIAEKSSTTIRREAYILALARHLERAGDHIVNIAEYICFMLTGERTASEADPNKDPFPREATNNVGPSGMPGQEYGG